MTEPTLNELALLAQGGNIHAVEALLRRCQQRVYSICRRMLRSAADAQDATQEILIKITTSLGSFRGDSDFATWAHRIAVNHVLSLLRSSRSEAERFDALANTLQQGLQFGAQQAAPAAEEPLLAYEVFAECAQKMLQCLDGPNRLALVLVDICDLDNDEAAAVLEIAPDALRQRLSRARRELSNFLGGRCGLANPDAACHCAKQVPAAVAFGTVSKGATRQDSPSVDSIAHSLQGLRDLARATRMLKQMPTEQAPANLVDEVRKLLSADRYRSLH